MTGNVWEGTGLYELVYVNANTIKLVNVACGLTLNIRMYVSSATLMFNSGWSNTVTVQTGPCITPTLFVAPTLS